MSILIKNGRVIDPASGRDDVADVLVEEGKIARVAPGIKTKADETIDAKGKIVAPGFVDIHVHLREPGREDKENIHSGTRAAAAGGFTSVCPMPNTTPVCDTAQGLQFLASRAKENAVVNIFPVAAVTVGQAGEAIVEFGDLVYYGAVAFSDDGNPIMNAEIMCRALEYTSMFNVPILDHCDNVDLSKGGQMRSGANSVRLGLKGIPPASESSQVARDIDLAQYTGGRVHICHVSVRQSVQHIANAKRAGVNVTCEATPHHLTLTDAAMAGYDANFKMSPPLGTEQDRQALIEGLRDGTIDCIATDHAPHTDMEKDNVMTEAPFGVIGLESAFPVLHTDLVAAGEIALNLLIEKMTVAPSRILNLKKGTLAEGADADIVVLDVHEKFVIEPQKFFSRSHNCPFAGKKVKGRAVATIVGGRLVFREGQIVV